MKDRWLNSFDCAEYFGLRPTRAGKPNRRGFIERIASQPSFPKPLIIGGEKHWKLSELEEWADEQRRAA